MAGAFEATFGEMSDISWPATVYVKPNRLALCTHCFCSSTPCRHCGWHGVVNIIASQLVEPGF